jgi:hypothetical protein
MIRDGQPRSGCRIGILIFYHSGSGVKIKAKGKDKTRNYLRWLSSPNIQVCHPPLRVPVQQKLAFVGRQPGNEVGSLAEHVEQVEDGQHHVQVEGGEQEGQVLHRAVEVAAEAVLDQQRREVEGPQDELFKGDCVTRNVEFFLPCHSLKHLLTTDQQCCGSGSVGSVCFLASWIPIRIH